MRNVKVFNRVLTPADVDQYMDDIESAYKKVCPEFCWTAYAVDELTLSISSKYRMTVPDEYKRDYDIVEAAAYAILRFIRDTMKSKASAKRSLTYWKTLRRCFMANLLGSSHLRLKGRSVHTIRRKMSWKTISASLMHFRGCRCLEAVICTI